jgi:hypothetical protein
VTAPPRGVYTAPGPIENMWLSIVFGSVLAIGQPPADETPPIPGKPRDETPTTPPEAPAERYFIMNQLQGTSFGSLLEEKRIQITGWTEGSFTGSSTRFDQLPMGWNYRANEFLLQQNWLRIEQTIDKNTTTPTFGFRSDTILPGSDYRFTVARGLFSSQLTANDGEPNTYGIDPVQFYGEAYFPNVLKGLDIKLGRFFAQFGQESNDTTQNALASRSYNFVYDPFTHTGLLTTLQIDDTWVVQNGIVMGCDVFIDPAARPCYIGSVKWAPPDGPDSALVSAILGSNRFDVRNNFHNPQIFDLVYTHKFNDKLTYALDALYGYTLGVPDIGFANWLAAVNYLTYQFSPRLSGTTRLEFFDDFQGQRTGFKGLYTAATAGVTFKPRPWIWLRPEVRYDYNGESRPFQDKHSLFTATFDVVLRW